MDIFRAKTPKIKVKKKPGRESVFTTEFMMMVAKKVVNGEMTYKEAQETFGVSQGSIAEWKKKYLKGKFNDTTPSNSPYKVSNAAKVSILEDQMKDLKREIGELYLENLMLKKALYHSRLTKKENSSVITSENLAQFQGDVE
jgi:transposase